MRSIPRRGLSAVLAGSLLLAGCATPDGAPNGRLAAETVGRGLVNLILSPFMIVAGIAQGLAFLPYTLATGLGELNRALLQAQAVPLDDSYKATFSVSMNDSRVDPRSGEIRGQEGLYGRYRPEAILEANRAFQRLLVSQGMPEEKARHYELTGNYGYAWSRGHILLAVVYRHPGAQPFRVLAKQTGIVTTFRPDQRGWYEPYERDVNGEAVDELIDWAALDYKLLRHDKVVATLMVLAVEAVKTGKRSPEYWDVERRWITGESGRIVRESASRVKIDGLGG
jgi:hypothetical protein